MLVALLLLAVPSENPELLRARALYGEMRYAAAEKALVKAITSPGLTPSDRAEIYLYTALCRHQDGDEAGALSAFREALTIDRTLELPTGVSPKARRTFEKARAELPVVEPSTPPPPPPPPQVEQPVGVTPPPEQPKVVIIEAPPPPPTKPKRWWPAAVSFGLAAGSLGGAIYSGTTATQTSNAAAMAMFASDGFPLSGSAQTYATVANVLYAVAGVFAALGIVCAIVF